MPITHNDINIYQAGQESLGGARSALVADGEVRNLFSTIEPGDTKYRCVYIVNGHDVLTLYDSVVSLTTDDANINLSLSAESIDETPVAVPDESTAPEGQSFSHTAALGDIPAGSHAAIWIKLTANGSAKTSDDLAANLSVKGDSEY